MAQVILRLIDSKRVLNYSQRMKPEQQTPMKTKMLKLERTEGTRENGNDQSDSQAGEIGFINHKDQFCVRQHEVNKIQGHFNAFYINRL